MRVCFLNNDLSPDTGSGKFYLSLVKALKELDPSLEVGVLVSGEVWGGGWLWFLFRGCFRLRSIFRRYDVIHALDGWPYGVIAVLASLGLNKKIVITAVGTGAVKPLYQPLKRQLLAWAYRRANKVVAVSSNTRREILKVLPDLKIEVVNHGVDHKKFEARNPKSETDSKIQNLKPYILSVGALKKRKGYDCSVRAFAEVSKRVPDLKYVIVGEGAELKNVQFLISNFQLQDKVVVFPKVEDDFLVDLYRNAEIFMLLPQDDSKDIEGFGLVFLEAAAAGLPVVSSLDTSAEDAVWNGRNGILVPPQDYQAAAAALSRILTDANLRGRFAAESKAVAAEMSWSKVALLYRNMYSTLIT